MTSRQPLVIISCDPEVVELAQELGLYDIIGILDPDPRASRLGVSVIGDDAFWTTLLKDRPNARAAMALDVARLKRRLVPNFGWDRLETLISPGAHVSAAATVGAGSIVQRSAKVMGGAELGRAVKVAIDAVVHHDCRVGDFSTIAPGARLLGSVIVEEAVYVGAHAVVLPRCRIGRNAMVGAGAVVARDVPADSTVTGVPARSISASEGLA